MKLQDVKHITNLILSFKPHNVELAENLMQGCDILGSGSHRFGQMPVLHPRLQNLWDFYIAYKIAEALPLAKITIHEQPREGEFQHAPNYRFLMAVVGADGTVYTSDYLYAIRKIGDRFRIMISDIYRVDAIAPLIQSMKAEVWFQIATSVKKDPAKFPSIEIHTLR